MATLDRIAARLRAEIERANHRTARALRPGTVAEYDPDNHKARIRLNGGQGAAFLSPWCNVLEAAGAGTSRTTLVAGQTVWLLCPNGDLRGAQVMPGDFSDEFKSSSKEAHETRFERGDVRVAIRPDEAEMSFGDTTVRVTAGHVRVHTTGTADFD